MGDFFTEMRVRYSETDQMAFMYYSNYLVWFEVARTTHFRSVGLDYNKIEKERKLYLPVVEANCRYKAPLRYDDLAKVYTKISDCGKSRLTFDYKIYLNEKLTTTGFTRHAFINEKGKPIPIPEDIRTHLLQ